MLRVGVIGLGKMGRLHLQNCRHIDGIQVTAVADASAKSLAWAEKRGIGGRYTGYTDLLEKGGVDAVIIALPHHLHLPAATGAMEAGIDVFLEKPLALRPEEGREIVATARRTGRAFMVGCNCRFIDSVVKVKAALDDGILGDIGIASLDNIGNGPFSPFLDPTPIPDWYFDPAQVGGGALLDLGYHMIDLFQWYFRDMELEFASLSNRYQLPYEDRAIVLLRSPRTGTKGIVSLGWFSRSLFPKFDFRVVLHGTVDHASTEHYTPGIYRNALTEGARNIFRRLTLRKIRPLTYTYYYHSYYLELEHFFSCIAAGGKPVITPEQSLRTLELIHEAYEKYPRV